MDRPVRVYLDNQDLSRLYKPRTAEFELVANALLAFEQSGLATFHYSYWHVFEFLQPADQRFMADRRERVRFLKRICRNNALPYFSDVIHDRPILSGIWLPSEVLDALTLDINKSLDDALSRQTLNRSARRKAGNGAFRRQALSVIFAGNAFERRNQYQFSLTPAFVSDGTFSKFARGEITVQTFRQRFARMFCDPEFFFQKWFVEGHRQSVINDQVAAIGNKWLQSVNELRAKVLEYQRARKAAVQSRREFYDRLRDSELPAPIQRSLAERVPKPPPPVTIGEVLAMGQIKDRRLRYLECYLRHYVMTEGTQMSDIADLMHLFYAPDMDLLRCDHAMHNIMRNCPHLPQSRIVSDLKSLPELIRALTLAQAA